MAVSPLLSMPGATAPAKGDTPEKVRDAAEQFESLLVSQILRSARQTDGGWLGTEDAAGECATDYAEQQFATVIAKQGGLGLANLIVKGLEAGNKGREQ
jgi:flagellar protein FlgJ